jgi:hypothetical protein
LPPRLNIVDLDGAAELIRSCFASRPSTFD